MRNHILWVYLLGILCIVFFLTFPSCKFEWIHSVNMAFFVKVKGAIFVGSSPKKTTMYSLPGLPSTLAVYLKALNSVSQKYWFTLHLTGLPCVSLFSGFLSICGTKWNKTQQTVHLHEIRASVQTQHVVWRQRLGGHIQVSGCTGSSSFIRTSWAVMPGWPAFEVGSFMEPLLFNRGSKAQSFFPTRNSSFY